MIPPKSRGGEKVKNTLFAAALCIGTAVSANPIRVISSAPATPATRSHTQPSEMEERMGQLQLNMLIDSVVASDETAGRLNHRASQAVASREH